MVTPDKYHRCDETAPTQQTRLTAWTWEGVSIMGPTGEIAEPFPQVPFFSHPVPGRGESRFKTDNSAGSVRTNGTCHARSRTADGWCKGHKQLHERQPTTRV